MTWSWTSDDKARWRHLRHTVATALEQEERIGRPGKGMLAELRRACARAMKARFPTNDPREVALLSVFLKVAESWCEAGGGALSPALARGLKQTELVAGALSPGAPAPSKRLPYVTPGYRAPYRDD